MRSKSLIRVPALLFVLLMLLAVGCGDSDSSDDSASDNDNTEQTDNGDDNGEDTGDDGGVPTGGTGDFCADFRAILEQYAGLGTEEDEVPSDEEWNAFVAALRGLTPPAEIAENWNTVVTGLGADPNEQLSDEEFATQSAAADEIETYVIAECGFNPSEI